MSKVSYWNCLIAWIVLVSIMSVMDILISGKFVPVYFDAMSIRMGIFVAILAICKASE